MSAADRQKWDARYQQQGPPSRSQEPLLTAYDARLPRRGRALDVAGGTGRNALWLAQRGLNVTLLDISAVALEQAAGAARVADVRLTTIAADLDDVQLPTGPWELIVASHFLWRPLFTLAPNLLAPGGWLIYVQPTRSNLQRHSSPSERFLLDDGELPGLLSELTIEHYDEAWRNSGRYEAWLAARKPEV